MAASTANPIASRLQNAGLSEAEFETSIREEIARSILQLAAVGGASAPDRNGRPIAGLPGTNPRLHGSDLGPDDLDTPVGQPDDATLTTYYQDNLDRYTQPAGKRLDYAWITPEMLVDTLEVEEAELRSAYEARARNTASRNAAWSSVWSCPTWLPRKMRSPVSTRATPRSKTWSPRAACRWKIPTWAM